MNDRRPSVLERPVIREQFRKELRGRLMSEAVVVLTPRSGRFALGRFSFPVVLRPALAVAAIAVLLFAGATSAAASSLPGDPLYAVKRATEDLQLALSFDGTARLHLLSELADRRLAELADVSEQRPSAASTATQDYADAAEKVALALADARVSNNNNDNQQSGEVEAAQDRRLKVLDSIKETVPSSARGGVERLLQREKGRRSTTPTTAPTTTAPATVPQTGDEQNSDSGGNTKATPRPATPTQQRATPKPSSSDDGNNEHRD
jgi:hypothetical protein